MSDKLSLDNPVFWNYALSSTTCLLKMGMMAPMTSVQRRKKRVFSNPEDVAYRGKGAKIDFTDQDVERVRRVHLNDLENIPLFVLMGGLYVLTDPPQYCAIWHFRLFAISRILHTVAYRWQFPQPCRGLCFTVGAFTTLSMAMQIFMKLFPNVTFEVGVSDYASIH